MLKSYGPGLMEPSDTRMIDVVQKFEQLKVELKDILK
jgi:hypothetical protein